MSETAKISIQGVETELPLLVGTENEVGIDISGLRAATGAVTLDFGYKNTGSTTSSIVLNQQLSSFIEISDIV